jgi:hypothetical protein
MNANENDTDDESRPSEEDDLNCTGNDVSLSVETPLSCNAFRYGLIIQVNSVYIKLDLYIFSLLHKNIFFQLWQL